MNKKIKQMISKDLGMDIEQIRHSSWEKLDKTHDKLIKLPFRPKDMFIVDANINLAENREMGTFLLEIRNIYRKLVHKIKCLMKNGKNAKMHYI